jgi:phage shock protein PspC (stress-responsive transcriptional regulator)
MKKILTILLFITWHTASFACEVCKKQQPKILRGITHGAGPQSEWDYVIVGVMTVIVITTLFYSVKWLIHPGEKNLNHIKNSILNFESP